MSKFKKQEERSIPKVSTASLPDIVFMLLFFFMVVTVLKENRMLVRTQVPQATEIKELKHRSLVNHVYVGPSLDVSKGSAPVIQINDAFINVYEVQEAMEILITTKPEAQRPLVTTALKVDREVSMGIVSDIKTELRKANQLKVNYTAIAKSEY